MVTLGTATTKNRLRERAKFIRNPGRDYRQGGTDFFERKREAKIFWGEKRGQKLFWREKRGQGLFEGKKGG